MEYKNPFSLYDFLGYFIPGALFFYGITLFNPTIIDELLNWDVIHRLGLFNQSIAFVVVSYMAGHAVNYISSVTIERYSIWAVKYPSHYLLNKEIESSYVRRMSDADLLVYLSGMTPRYPCRRLLIWIRKCINCVKWCKKKRIANLRFVSSLWRVLLFAILFPMTIIDCVIGKGFRFRAFYVNTLDSSLISIIQSRLVRFNALHGYKINGKDGDFFRIVWHYYYEKYPQHRVKFDNYVALYGFARSMSFLFCLFSWVSLISFFSVDNYSFSIYTPLFLGLFSFVFFLAFMKFYRRYTLEGLMCLVIDETLDDNTNN